MRQLASTLFFRNPMAVEMKRVAKRLTNFRRAGASVGLGLVVYVLIVVVVWSNRTALSPIHVVLAQTIFFGLMIPSLMYGAISGERERRSWDLLLVAPVTKAQVVVGKFMGAVAALAIGAVMFLVPCGLVLCIQGFQCCRLARSRDGLLNLLHPGLRRDHAILGPF